MPLKQRDQRPVFTTRQGQNLEILDIIESVYCSVVTSVNHTNTRFRGITHCPCSGCENGVNKSELSFDIWWLYLNGTTPHLATRIHEANPVREFKSQSADVKATQIPKRGQDNPDIPSTTWRSRYRLSRLSKFI